MATISLNGQVLDVTNPNKTKSNTPILIQRMVGNEIRDTDDVIPITRICPQSRYSLSTQGKTIDSTGVVGGSSQPFVFTPVDGGYILKGVPFRAIIYAGETPLRVTQMTLDGDDVPDVISTCKECGCPTGKRCTDNGTCVSPIKTCTGCGGDCYGKCENGFLCVKSQTGEYSCEIDTERGPDWGYLLIGALITISVLIVILIAYYSFFKSK